MNKLKVAAALALVTACAKGADRADTTGGKSDTVGMAGMSMPGMMSPATMDSMTLHLRAMDTAAGSSLLGMLPMHRQSVANMLSKMNAEMRGMNMSADAKWSALADSVRQDLVRLPEMSAQQLKQNMPAHEGRVTRLMEAHKAMMKM